MDRHAAVAFALEIAQSNGSRPGKANPGIIAWRFGSAARTHQPQEHFYAHLHP